VNDITRVISRLEQQRASIDRALAALREIEAVTPADDPPLRSAAGVGKPKKRRMSAAGRKNIAEAVRRRWAEKRAAESAQSSKPVPTGKTGTRKKSTDKRAKKKMDSTAA
jgi:uncharacterized protein YyaL (SSP411 family)